MAQAFVLILVGLTSLLALLIGVRGLRLPLVGLAPATAKALECIGVMLAFVVLNTVMGMLGVLLWRRLTDTFLSLYSINDMALLVSSLLQGLIFQWWRKESREPRL